MLRARLALLRAVNRPVVAPSANPSGRLSPTTADSRAPYLWSSKATRGSKLAPAPSGIGKMVRKPWMVSKANMIGIFSRDSSTAMRWSSLIRAASVTLRTEPRTLFGRYVARPLRPDFQAWK